MVQNVVGLPKRQPKTVRIPHFMPEKDVQDILAPEDHKQGNLSRTDQWVITRVIMQRIWRWLEHVIRKNRKSIKRAALRWTPDNIRRNRGRSRKTRRRRSRQKWKQQERHGKNLSRQRWIGSNVNPWSQPYMPPRCEKDHVINTNRLLHPCC